MSLTKLQLKHYNQGMVQVKAANAQAMADGVNDMETWVGWLESWRLGRLQSRMEELGAYLQQDLLDLDPSE